MSVIKNVIPLNGPWPTLDPFLFCVHHVDHYPQGNGKFGPNASLNGRQIGQDFSGKDGWNMYHGESVPGFPQHPHRGFETVTIARHGFIDHADSLGASARFGRGDLQWMTAGEGVVHSEMFPLLDENAGNHTELFQIWLNLPAQKKMAPPEFAMFWNEDIPHAIEHDEKGRVTEIVSYARAYNPGMQPATPPANSWAADPQNFVTIWTLRMEPGATWTLPPTEAECNRGLYFFQGTTAALAGNSVQAGNAYFLEAGYETAIVNGPEEAEFLLLEGRPIGEPVVQYGPFVMNDQAGLKRAFSDYQQTQFGGWRWPSSGPVHGPQMKRFARLPDGSELLPSE